ncbi:hypothetical protein [Floridanema evergladense]|uniref:Uncharacterized protein n=1 Tax=Floridaenema evergladense BLCC-F167 TaxID=3153639 RepID=A0ABV4WQF1_9CYAN
MNSIDTTKTEDGSNLPAPKNYRNHWFMNMEIDAEPIGFDLLTSSKISWQEESNISCDINTDRASLVPFQKLKRPLPKRCDRKN